MAGFIGLVLLFELGEYLDPLPFLLFLIGDFALVVWLFGKFTEITKEMREMQGLDEEGKRQYRRRQEAVKKILRNMNSNPPPFTEENEPGEDNRKIDWLNVKYTGTVVRKIADPDDECMKELAKKKRKKARDLKKSAANPEKQFEE